ncbi:Pectate lyase superfamily protein [compost metagenome]
MTNTYNTLNPLGSTSPKDLFDNASNFDEAMNSLSPSFYDRFSKRRETWAGMEKMVSDFLESMGFEATHLVYVDGVPLQVDRPTQLIDRAGSVYKVKQPASFPVNLTGTWATDQLLLVDVGDASLRALLLSPAGASNVFGQLSALGTVAQSIQDYMRNKIFIGQFGAVCDGVTNDAPAIRLALDAIPADGGAISFPDWGTCKVIGTIFIPQRIPVSGVAGQGVQLIGNNCTIIGDGTSTIFESGTGTKSTVALGGASNWPLGDELPTTIHYNSRIEGFNFKTCGTAMKLKNWIQGCSVERCYATDFTDHMLWTNRSFYLSQTDLTGRPFRNDRTDLTPIFRHDGFNNTMSFTGVHGSGIGPDTFTHGTGIGFDGGVEGLVLGNGLSFEACKNGILLESIVYSLDINGVYFEVCDAAIRSIGANIEHMSVDNCRFNACSTNVNVDNWTNGSFGPGNDTQAGLVVFGNGCTHDVYYPSQQLTSVTHTAWKRVPDGWVVPAGCQVHRNDMIYNNAVGFDAVLFRDAPASSGNTGVVPMSYTGDCFDVGGMVPFCALNTSVPGQLIVDTLIYWHPSMSAVEFDLGITHSQLDVISGRLSCNNTIMRYDSVAGKTVTAVQNGDFLRFILTGFGTISLVTGRVRIV